MTVLVVLVSARLPNLEPATTILLYLVVVTTLSSGLHYMFRMSRLERPSPVS